MLDSKSQGLILSLTLLLRHSGCSVGASNSPLNSPFLPSSPTPNFFLKKVSEERKAQFPILGSYCSFLPLRLPAAQIPAKALSFWPYLNTNPAYGRHIITACLESIKLSCPGSCAWLLWPWSLGLVNPPGSWVAQYTHFQLIWLTALVEKLIRVQKTYCW